MTRDEIYDAIDYWNNEANRAQQMIYECEDNVQELYQQLNSLEEE